MVELEVPAGTEEPLFPYPIEVGALAWLPSHLAAVDHLLLAVFVCDEVGFLIPTAHAQHEAGGERISERKTGRIVGRLRRDLVFEATVGTTQFEAPPQWNGLALDAERVVAEIRLILVVLVGRPAGDDSPVV